MATKSPKDEIMLLIDCDPGVDDLAAIMMAFSQAPRVKTVAITCVAGNSDIDDVVMNALRTVKLYNLIGKVPVFRGCSSSLLAAPMLGKKMNYYHGKDGFGDVPEVEPRRDEELFKYEEKEHAVNAIIRLSKEYEGKLMVVAIGPLTNLAVAVRLDPELPSRLHSLHIMGGTLRGHGNVGLCAEFNFFIDPEAASIVLNTFSGMCHVQLTTFETTADHVIPRAWHDEWMNSVDNPRGDFFRRAYKVVDPFELKPEHPDRKAIGYCIYDAYTMCTALRPESVLKSRKLRVCVETGGLVSRGNLLFNYMNRESPHLTRGTITVVEEIDMDIYKEMLIKALQ